MSDLRHALRQLKKSPGFAVTAVVTLSLGIGATAAIFTLIQQVMLRSLPVANPHQLWRVGDAVTCCYSNGYTQRNPRAQNDWTLFSWEAYKRFRSDTAAFEELAGFQVGEGNAELAVRRAGSPTAVQARDGEYVSGNFFRTFGISAWRGRVFTDADDEEGAAAVAVMSFHTWQDHYGSDPSVVGATYEINGHLFTMIGVAPPTFFGAKVADSSMPDIWLPLTKEPVIAGATSRLKNPGVAWLDLIGRVRPGTNPRGLEAQLQGELRVWLASHRADMTPLERMLAAQQTLHLTPGGAGVSLMREDYEDSLRLLLMAAVSVLLLACANLATLLLARGVRTKPQTAVRVALGASRGRLVRQALVESAALATMGGAAGIAVAYGGARLIMHLAFAGRSAWVPMDPAPSAPVLFFTLGISLITGLVFGIVPAWMSSNADPLEAMRGAHWTVGGRGRRVKGLFGTAGTQQALVTAQVAISVTLLSAAAMLGQSLHNLEHQRFGFVAGDRYLVSIDPKLSNYRQEQLVPFFRDIEARLSAIPGVRMASPVLYAPMSGSYWAHDIRVAGRPEPRLGDDASSTWTRVTPGFFRTLEDGIVSGRPITEDDNRQTRLVAVVNEAFARKFFGPENPIGQHFGPAPRQNADKYEIVGIAADVHYFASAWHGPERPMYFLPEAQGTQFDEADLESRELWSHYLYNIVIWAPGNPSGLTAAVRDALTTVDPNLVMNGVEPYSELIHRNFAQQNMIASLTALFGAIGLVLAVVGLYGVTAYGVEQRTSEIGVRMALGADRRTVVTMVLRRAFQPVGIGLALGIPAAVGAGHAIASQLFGVAPSDPRLLFGATLLLGVAAIMAAAIPAVRAAGVDPFETLRSE